MYPHWFHDLHAPLVAATPNARMVEFFPDNKVLNFRELLDRQLGFRGRRLMPHAGPGLGFAFDEEKVGRFALDATNVWTKNRAADRPTRAKELACLPPFDVP